MRRYLYYDKNRKCWSQSVKEAVIEAMFIDGRLRISDWCCGPLPSSEYSKLGEHPTLCKEVPLWSVMARIHELWELKRDALLHYVRDPNQETVGWDSELEKKVDVAVEEILSVWRREGDVLDKEIIWRTKGGGSHDFIFPEDLSYDEKKDALNDWLEAKCIDDNPGSYAFFKGDSTLYVGQSSHLISRLAKHSSSEREFCDAADRVSFWQVKLNVGFAMTRHLDLERLLILRHQPIHNKNHGSPGGNYSDMQLDEISVLLTELIRLPDRFY